MSECKNPCKYCEYYYYGDRTCRHKTALIEIDYVDGYDVYRFCKVHRENGHVIDIKSKDKITIPNCGTEGQYYKRNTRDD